MAVSYMTKDGYDKILAEINYLETVKRPEISAQIAEARDKGELSGSKAFPVEGLDFKCPPDRRNPCSNR